MLFLKEMAVLLIEVKVLIEILERLISQNSLPKVYIKTSFFYWYFNFDKKKCLKFQNFFT